MIPKGFHRDLFGPPREERRAETPAGLMFSYKGRFMTVVDASHGTDPAAPVIIEEMQAIGQAHKGQLGLWSHEAVSAAIADPFAKPNIKGDTKP